MEEDRTSWRNAGRSYRTRFCSLVRLLPLAHLADTRGRLAGLRYRMI